MSEEYKFIVDPESDSSPEVQTAKIEEDAESGIERKFKVRLYKWLCAARFFKTPELAQAAIESGAVFYNGEPSKPSREIELGAVLQIRRGRIEKTVIIKGLSTRRRSQEEALKLYEETEESKSAREQLESDTQETNFNQIGLDYAAAQPYQAPQYGYNRDLRREKRPGFVKRPGHQTQGKPQGFYSQNQAAYPTNTNSTNYYGNSSNTGRNPGIRNPSMRKPGIRNPSQRHPSQRNPEITTKQRTNHSQYGGYYQQDYPGNYQRPQQKRTHPSDQQFSKPAFKPTVKLAHKPAKFYIAPKMDGTKPELRGPFIRRRKKEIETFE